MDNKPIIAIILDPENKSDPFTYMARSRDTNKYVSGNVIVQKPWYSSPQNHIYHIAENDYTDNGLCGGREFKGFILTEVDPSTIEPYTQINQIKMHLSNNLIVNIVDRETRNLIKTIKSENDIPFELWDI